MAGDDGGGGGAPLAAAWDDDDDDDHDDVDSSSELREWDDCGDEPPFCMRRCVYPGRRRTRPPLGLSPPSPSSARGNDGGIAESGEIRAMSFDRQGVLLATGDDRGNVRLYDFDDVGSGSGGAQPPLLDVRVGASPRWRRGASYRSTECGELPQCWGCANS